MPESHSKGKHNEDKILDLERGIKEMTENQELFDSDGNLINKEDVLKAEIEASKRKAEADQAAKLAEQQKTYNTLADSLWSRMLKVDASLDPMTNENARSVYQSLKSGDVTRAEGVISLLEKEQARQRAWQQYAHGEISLQQARDAGVKL